VKSDGSDEIVMNQACCRRRPGDNENEIVRAAVLWPPEGPPRAIGIGVMSNASE